MDNPVWKGRILSALERRDHIQSTCFEAIFSDYSKLRDHVCQLTKEIASKAGELKSLRQENVELSLKLEKASAIKSYDYEQKVFRLQEEVTELHRQKGLLANDVIELNKSVQEKDKALSLNSTKIAETEQDAKKLQAANIRLLDEVHSLEKANKLLIEEKSATADMLESVRSKNRDLEDDRVKLIDRMSKLQKIVENLKNIEHDVNYRKTQELIRKQLADAASISVGEPALSGCTAACPSVVPHKMLSEFNACEGEVNSVRFTPSGKLFGSGGFDRKLRLWAVVDGTCQLRSTLVGCNAAITAIDFDPNETSVLGASSDFSCRVWTLNDSRLRVNLTGHSERVVSAKFMGSNKRAVTVSSDRTIKLWDIDRCQCKRTILAGSAPQDVVVVAPTGAVATGHFDHNIRLWDERTGTSTDVIELSARITGLDISTDCTELLACTRNNTVEVVNLRTKRVTQRLSAEEFRIGLDIVRPSFSPDAKYAVAGGQDGGVYIWNTLTGQLEQCLSGHSRNDSALALYSGGPRFCEPVRRCTRPRDSPGPRATDVALVEANHHNIVVCCHWSPSGRSIVSCERINRAIIWSSF